MFLSLRPLQPMLAVLVSFCVAVVLLGGSGSGVAAQTATIFAEGDGPAYLAMDSAGNIFASAPFDGELLKLNATTLQVVARFPTPAGVYLQEPIGIAVVGTSLYTVDITNNHLLRFSTINGSLIASYALTAYGVIEPIALAAAPNGSSLYLTDVGANPLHQVSLNGTLIQTFNTSSFLLNNFGNTQSLGVDASTATYISAPTSSTPSPSASPPPPSSTSSAPPARSSAASTSPPARVT